jgi:hypothetical protein
VPFVVGVPERTPVAEFKVTPAGSVPEARLHTYGVFPPVAASAAEYGIWVTPFGTEVLVMASGTGAEVTVTAKACEAVWGVDSGSVTATVNANCPVTLGVPVIAPVVAERLRPVGN